MENLTTKLGQKGLIKRHEFIRVIIQCLYSLGYGKSAACLESESSVLNKSAEFKLLESQILSANWDDCVDSLYGFTDLTDETRALTLFLVFKQCLLEFLSRGDYSMALALLRKQISTLKVGKEKVHKLAFGMLLRKEMDLGKMDDHIIDELRKGLLRKLEKVLPPPISFPERRLEHLVEMAVSAQIDSCMYHNSTDAITIYEDHNCGRDQIPTETIQILTDHENEVWFVQFSNNGQYLASSSSDCTAIVWKVMEDGKLTLKHTLRSHQNPVSFVAWSPDDTMLLTCGNAEVLKLWDVETGTCKHTFGDHGFIVSSCAWFPDSKRLVCGSSDPEKGIYMWDSDGNEIKAWRGMRMPKVLDLAVTPDGETLVSIFSDKEIRVLNVLTNDERVISEEHPITSLSISGDSKFLIVNLNSQEIHMWDVAGKWGKPLKYKGHVQNKYVIRSCFGGLNSTFIASGSEDSHVYIWNRRDSDPMEVLFGHSMTVNCVSWNPRRPQMLASASDDQTIRIWGPCNSEKMKSKIYPFEQANVTNEIMAGRLWLDDPNSASVSALQPQVHRNGRNVFHLLQQREISPRTKCLARKQWGEASKLDVEYYFEPKVERVRDARRELLSWVEAESLHHLSAKYCSLVPAPRSTIAAAFSPDGKTLASTHGDHTVKLIDCHSGSCLRVLSGHRRTPWVVRFHPLHPEILASGSLDHEVRLWNSSTSECIGSRDFYRPIASIAFHAEGELLAVASGHKLYLWNYNRSGEPSSPTIVLKTRRSLRAVHFHPHAAPLLLTAEVNDIDSSDSSVARATSLGCLHYPPPSVFLANVRPSDSLSLASELPLMSSPLSYVPSIARDYSRTDVQVGNLHADSSSIQAEYSAEMQLEIDLNSTGQYDQRVSPTEMSPAIRSNAQSTVEAALPSYYPRGMQSADRDAMIDVQLAEGYQPGSSSNVDAFGADSSALPFISQSNGGSIQIQPDRVLAEFRQNQFLPSTDPTCWELPFLQGWLMGQRQAGMPSMPPHTGGGQEYSSGYLGDHPLHARFIFPAEDSQGSRFSNPNNGSGGGDYVPMISRIHSDLAASITATAAAELPCTVKLRIWPHNLKNPCASLNDERCLLTVPHAVLCSEMGAHFSPCGRFLAACVACVLPETEADLGLLSQFHNNATEDATSPTRHPISARQVMYELRIYSLEDPTFGSVLVSRAIRAAHCLTSIQFSPTSEHLLLAYGRRHSSLLKSIVVNEETSLPIYTVLEVYRVSNLELVSILPSAEDEVNVACFHPLAGGGLAYGTKEGKLRVLQYDGAHDLNYTRSNILSQKNLVQVQAYALEC